MASDHDRCDKIIRFGNGLQDEIEARRESASWDAERRQARLAFILENLAIDGCYEHGEEFTTRADCWAREIIALEPTWA